MSKTSMEITMSEDLKARLQNLAASQGKTVQEFAQEALSPMSKTLSDGVLSDVALTQEGLMYVHPEGDKAVALEHSVLEASRKTA